LFIFKFFSGLIIFFILAFEKEGLKKASREQEIPSEASYWYLSEVYSHTTLQKGRCFVDGLLGYRWTKPNLLCVKNTLDG